MSGVPLEGIWYDRAREYLARIKGEETRPGNFAEPETLTFQPLPCWSHLSPEAYRARIAAIIEEIETNAATERERTGRQPLGAEAMRRQEPTTQPNRIKKSPAPRFHAFTKRVRQELYQALLLVPGGLSRSGGETAPGRSAGKLPSRMLPPSPALCP